MLKNLVYLSIFTTFVVLVWISLTIYHNLKASTVSQDVSIQITPLKPSFNTKVISGLQTRQQITVDLSSTIATPAASVPSQGISPTVTIPVSPTQIPQPQPSTASAGLAPNL